MDSSGRHETGTLKSLKIYKGYQQSCDTVKNPWYTKERNNNQIGDVHDEKVNNRLKLQLRAMRMLTVGRP